MHTFVQIKEGHQAMYIETEKYLENLKLAFSSEIIREKDPNPKKGSSVKGQLPEEELFLLLEFFLDFLRIYSNQDEDSLDHWEQDFFRNCAMEYEKVKGPKLAVWKLFSPMMVLSDKKLNPSKQMALRRVALIVIEAESVGGERRLVPASKKVRTFFGLNETKQCKILVSSIGEVLYKY